MGCSAGHIYTRRDCRNCRRNKARRDYKEPGYQHLCVRCGGEWTSWVESPERCRHCGSASYDVPRGYVPVNLQGLISPEFNRKWSPLKGKTYGASGTLGRGEEV